MGPAQRHEVHHRLGAEQTQEVPTFLLKKNGYFYLKKSNFAGATSPSSGRAWSTLAKTHFHERVKNIIYGFFCLYLGCSHTFTPSHSDEECRRLREYLAKDKEEDGEKVPGEGYAGVKILSEEEEELATCYEEMPGKYGW